MSGTRTSDTRMTSTMCIRVTTSGYVRTTRFVYVIISSYPALTTILERVGTSYFQLYNETPSVCGHEITIYSTSTSACSLTNDCDLRFFGDLAVINYAMGSIIRKGMRLTLATIGCYGAIGLDCGSLGFLRNFTTIETSGGRSITTYVCVIKVFKITSSVRSISRSTITNLPYFTRVLDVMDLRLYIELPSGP